MLYLSLYIVFYIIFTRQISIFGSPLRTNDHDRTQEPGPSCFFGSFWINAIDRSIDRSILSYQEGHCSIRSVGHLCCFGSFGSKSTVRSNVRSLCKRMIDRSEMIAGPSCFFWAFGPKARSISPHNTQYNNQTHNGIIVGVTLHVGRCSLFLFFMSMVAAARKIK